MLSLKKKENYYNIDLLLFLVFPLFLSVVSFFFGFSRAVCRDLHFVGPQIYCNTFAFIVLENSFSPPAIFLCFPLIISLSISFLLRLLLFNVRGARSFLLSEANSFSCFYFHTHSLSSSHHTQQRAGVFWE